MNLYQRYRNWQKNRGRAKKTERKLQKAVSFYSPFVKQDNLCFDVGANMGNRTETFLRLGAKVVAVEPQKLCQENLKKRFANNPNVTIVPLALDKISGQADIYISESHTLSSMSNQWIEKIQHSGRFSTVKWDDKDTIQTTTLDNLVEQYGMPTFCKIDVEGYELNVLQGLTKPIPMVSFEFAAESIDNSIKCIEYLRGLGNAQFNYSLAESLELELNEWGNGEDIVQIVKSCRSKDFSSSVGDIYCKFII